MTLFTVVGAVLLWLSPLSPRSPPPPTPADVAPELVDVPSSMELAPAAQDDTSSALAWWIERAMVRAIVTQSDEHVTPERAYELSRIADEMVDVLVTDVTIEPDDLLVWAARLVVTGFVESTYRQDAIGGYRRSCWGMFQHQSWGRPVSPEGWTMRDFLGDLRKQIVVALRQLRESFRVCGSFALYLAGSCTSAAGRAQDGYRHRLEHRLLREVSYEELED